MAGTTRFVCLANSRRPGGRCVAGVQLQGRMVGPWFRPVSATEHSGVSAADRQYDGGSEPRLLDIVELEILGARPAGFQTENVVLDDSTYWRRVGMFGWENLADIEESDGPLWPLGHHTQPGFNDQVPDEIAAGLSDSLRLIRIESLVLKVLVPHPRYGHDLKVLAEFEFDGAIYRLRVTDPEIEDTYVPQGEDEHELGECYLTISLAESFQGASSKLVAGIMQRDLLERDDV